MMQHPMKAKVTLKGLKLDLNAANEIVPLTNCPIRDY